jgi:hypothetical protein
VESTRQLAQFMGHFNRLRLWSVRGRSGRRRHPETSSRPPHEDKVWSRRYQGHPGQRRGAGPGGPAGVPALPTKGFQPER